MLWEKQMRATLLILILVVATLIAAIATGYIDITQTRQARAPKIKAADGKISATPGRMPAFEAETGSVEVGTREANVTMPKFEVKSDKKKMAVPTIRIRPADADKAEGNTSR